MFNQSSTLADRAELANLLRRARREDRFEETLTLKDLDPLAEQDPEFARNLAAARS